MRSDFSGYFFQIIVDMFGLFGLWPLSLRAGPGIVGSQLELRLIAASWIVRQSVRLILWPPVLGFLWAFRVIWGSGGFCSVHIVGDA